MQLEMFDEKGKITESGASRHMVYRYQRSLIHASPIKIKEWDFYQFQKENIILQFTFAKALCMENFFACYMDVLTGKTYYISETHPIHSHSLDLCDNPEKDFLYSVNRKDLTILVQNSDGNREIQFEYTGKKYKKFSFHVLFKSHEDANRITILHKFAESEKMFYLNQKENYFDACADVQIENDTDCLSYKETNMGGVLDFGRGYWPLDNRWYWSNLSTYAEGKPFGWNLGYGFGTCPDTENIVYYDNESYKLGKITTTIENDNPKKNIVIDDEEGRLHMELSFVYDNFSHTEILWLYKFCHQVYYYANGSFKINGKEIPLANQLVFFEHEENHW